MLIMVCYHGHAAQIKLKRAGFTNAHMLASSMFVNIRRIHLFSWLGVLVLQESSSKLEILPH